MKNWHLRCGCQRTPGVRWPLCPQVPVAPRHLGIPGTGKDNQQFFQGLPPLLMFFRGAPGRREVSLSSLKPKAPHLGSLSLQECPAFG